jgi:hypothetical protein
MDDVIRLGTGRGPGRRISRLIATAAIAVLAAAMVLHLPDDRHSPSHRATIKVSGGPVQLAGLGSGAARLLNKPDRVDQQKTQPVTWHGSLRRRTHTGRGNGD